MEPIFKSDQQVRGIKFFEFLDWASQSLFPSDPEESSPDSRESKEVLGIPPLQRSIVWRPHQILDLWDSVFRNLPIGSMMLLPRGEGAITRLNNKTTFPKPGYDLLDGQQRVYALLLGWCDKYQDAGKLLWIDFAAEPPKRKIFGLYLTSIAQPFGYKPNGDRYGVADRRKARMSFEKKTGRAFENKYDHELFDLPWDQLDPDGDKRPKPIGASKPLPLRDVLKICDTDSTPEKWISEFTNRFFKPQVDDQLRKFFCSIRHIKNSQIALIKVDPQSCGIENIRLLFDRVGQNGTALSNEERLYSIFKQIDPKVHDTVQNILGKDGAGHVLSPAKLMGTAIRSAFVQFDKESREGRDVYMPSPETFQKLLANESFRKIIRRLIPESQDPQLEERRDPNLGDYYKILRETLSFKGGDDCGLPRVLLPTLGARLYEVLIFWLFYNSDNDADKAEAIANDSRIELLRFIFFWNVFLENANRGADCALNFLRDNRKDIFPGRELCKEVVEGDQRRRNGQLIVDPEEFEKKIGSIIGSEKNQLRKHLDDDNNRIIKLFWWSRESVLPWIQRGYLQSKFKDYDPTLGYENEVPFDYDHICPQAEVSKWGIYSKDRDCLQESIGNYWILHGPLNRSLGALAAPKKLKGDGLSNGDKEIFENARNEAFGDNLKDWNALNDSDKPDDKWSLERGIAFQCAVEKRTIWLYKKMFVDLGFEEWKKEVDQNEEPSRHSRQL